MAIGIANGVKAQFSGSQQVYCYQYVKTINDDVISKEGSSNIYFINFQQDMIGIEIASDANDVGKKLIDDPNYYNDRAINDLGERYRKWKAQAPGSVSGIHFSTVIYKYDSNYSTTSKYSYRECNKENVWKNGVGIMGVGDYVWSEPRWRNKVYTFSIDRSEMIIWSVSDPGNRQYYKKIDPNILKPKTDFLY